jgi:death-on-curing protein
MFGTNQYEDYMVLNYLHSQIMERLSGPWGQRDPGLTRAAVARPFRSAFGQEMYGDIYLKAAALMDSIVNNVVFRDGNKRTALAAAALYLALNDCVLSFGQNEADMFMHQLVMHRPPITAIAAWLRAHTKPKQLMN